MILARRILPFVAPLSLAGMYSGLLFVPTQWKAWLGAILVLVLFAMSFMMQWRVLTGRFWITVFPIAMLLIGGTGFLFFLRSTVAQLLFVLFLVVLFGLYLEDVFILNYQSFKYSSLSLPNISFFINTCAGFSLFACGYALQLIGIVPIWLITVTAFLFSGAMVLHLFWSYNIWDRKHLLTVFILSLCITELVWILQYWPTAFFVNGILVAIVLYCVPSLAQLHIRNALSRQLFIRYVTISLVMVASVVSTSQWS